MVPSLGKVLLLELVHRVSKHHGPEGLVHALAQNQVGCWPIAQILHDAGHLLGRMAHPSCCPCGPLDGLAAWKRPRTVGPERIIVGVTQADPKEKTSKFKRTCGDSRFLFASKHCCKPRNRGKHATPVLDEDLLDVLRGPVRVLRENASSCWSCACNAYSSFSLLWIPTCWSSCPT